jgi:hypothetical protein
MFLVIVYESRDPVVVQPELREEDWPPENLPIERWSHAGCGFNLSAVCLLC